jgi:hypothetical protein
MPVVSRSVTIVLTVEELETILKKHFNMPNADVSFTVSSDPTDDGPGYPRQKLAGCSLVAREESPLDSEQLNTAYKSPQL